VCPVFLLNKKGGVMKMQFFSAENTWEGLLAAAIVMSLILLLAMLAGNYL
jgi:hypothetical protein